MGDVNAGVPAAASDVMGWVVHLPLAVADRATALDLAATIADMLAARPEVTVAEVSVSPEDNQSARVPVFCNRLLPARTDRARCGLRANHYAACTPGRPA